MTEEIKYRWEIVIPEGVKKYYSAEDQARLLACNNNPDIAKCQTRDEVKLKITNMGITHWTPGYIIKRIPI